MHSIIRSNLFPLFPTLSDCLCHTDFDDFSMSECYAHLVRLTHVDLPKILSHQDAKSIILIRYGSLLADEILSWIQDKEEDIQDKEKYIKVLQSYQKANDLIINQRKENDPTLDSLDSFAAFIIEKFKHQHETLLASFHTNIPKRNVLPFTIFPSGFPCEQPIVRSVHNPADIRVVLDRPYPFPYLNHLMYTGMIESVYEQEKDVPPNNMMERVWSSYTPQVGSTPRSGYISSSSSSDTTNQQETIGRVHLYEEGNDTPQQVCGYRIQSLGKYSHREYGEHRSIRTSSSLFGPIARTSIQQYHTSYTFDFDDNGTVTDIKNIKNTKISGVISFEKTLASMICTQYSSNEEQIVLELTETDHSILLPFHEWLSYYQFDPSIQRRYIFQLEDHLHRYLTTLSNHPTAPFLWKNPEPVINYVMVQPSASSTLRFYITNVGRDSSILLPRTRLIWHPFFNPVCINNQVRFSTFTSPKYRTNGSICYKEDVKHFPSYSIHEEVIKKDQFLAFETIWTDAQKHGMEVAGFIDEDWYPHVLYSGVFNTVYASGHDKASFHTHPASHAHDYASFIPSATDMLYCIRQQVERHYVVTANGIWSIRALPDIMIPYDTLNVWHIYYHILAWAFINRMGPYAGASYAGASYAGASLAEALSLFTTYSATVYVEDVVSSVVSENNLDSIIAMFTDHLSSNEPDTISSLIQTKSTQWIIDQIRQIDGMQFINIHFLYLHPLVIESIKETFDQVKILSPIERSNAEQSNEVHMPDIPDTNIIDKEKNNMVSNVLVSSLLVSSLLSFMFGL